MPHFSTVSYNFKHRFNHGTVEYVFRWVLKAAAEEGYLDTEAIFVDGTHIKASANLKKQAKKAVPKQAKRYAKELFAEVNRDREEHGKKPFSDDSDKNPPQEKQTKETVVSTTDPESGVFHKKVLCLRGAHGLRQAQFCSWCLRHSRQCPRQRSL